MIKPNFRTSEKDYRTIHIAIVKWSQTHFSQSCFHFNFFGQNCQVHSEMWLETLNGQKVLRVTQQGLHLYTKILFTFNHKGHKQTGRIKWVFSTAYGTFSFPTCFSHLSPDRNGSALRDKDG